MKKNMGNLDRYLRIGAAIIVGVLYFANVISGTIAIVLGIIAGVFILTSSVNFCPLYSALGIKTNKPDADAVKTDK